MNGIRFEAENLAPGQDARTGTNRVLPAGVVAARRDTATAATWATEAREAVRDTDNRAPTRPPSPALAEPTIKSHRDSDR
jgi:hypothetical protein